MTEIELTQFGGFYVKYQRDLADALQGINWEQIAKAADLIKNCRGTVWLIGNGGSASLASHMATDLALAGKRAIALTDIAAVTTWANDEGWVDCFKQQLDRLEDKEDILIAITGSGNSLNIRRAMGYFKGRSIAITGFDGGGLGKFADMTGSGILHINVPSTHMGVAQDGHQIVLHIICYYLMERRKLQ